MTLTNSSDQKKVGESTASSRKADKTQPSRVPVQAREPNKSQAPTSKIRDDSTIPTESGLKDLERKLANALDADLKTMRDDSGTTPKPSSANGAAGANAVAPAQSKAPTDKTVSGRTLELQRKKSAANEMRAKLKQGADLLNSLLGTNDAFIAYLAKTEQELAHLERAEGRSVETQALAEEMLREQKKLTAKYKEQVKQIELLEATKVRYRTAIESARSEIDRLKQQAEVLRHETESKTVSITVLEDGKAQLSDANQALQLESRKNRDSLKAQALRIEELEARISTLQVKFDEETQSKDQFIAERDKAVVDLNDLTIRFEGVSAERAELKAQLDEKVFEIESKRKAHEDAISSRDARIKDLEVELIAVKKAKVKEEGKDTDPLLKLGLAGLSSAAAAKPKLVEPPLSPLSGEMTKDSSKENSKEKTRAA